MGGETPARLLSDGGMRRETRNELKEKTKMAASTRGGLGVPYEAVMETRGYIMGSS